ncbi:MAG TPA: spherulation-specific family 4 protein [Terriglobales bacterium]|jgi:hypothetical protein|nr:spherulation-specific family 4 protein [Terriglobales bacterium]
MRDVARSAALSLMAAVFLIALPLSAQIRLAVPSYQNPGTTIWKNWAAQGPGANGLMIVNLKNGDDTSYKSSIDTAIQNARKQGILVIGYTYTGYATRDPKIVRQRIDSVYANYLVDGIFFDEVNNDCSGTNTFFPSNYLYYQELTNYVRQKGGAHITVMNPGTPSPDDCYMSITNILVNWESTAGYAAYQTGYIDYPWTHRYPADRFWHMILGVTQAQMPAALSLASSRNAGWVYISDSPTNAYNQVPVYWTALGTAIKAQGTQSPYAVATTDRVSMKWKAVGGAVWQVYIDADQQATTGYTSSSIGVGAEYMLESSAAGGTHLYRYAGSGADWAWTEIPANAITTHPDIGLNLVMFDRAGLAGATAVTYQIRSLDASYNVLSTSYTMPFSLQNGSFVQDINNHP